jgi:hypothetical protein
MAASAAHSSSVVPVAGDATASPGALAPSEGRDRRGQKLMEEKMRVLTINELLRMTRKELCGLAAHIAARLPTYCEGSAARTAAHINLRNIRWALARRDFSP